MDEKIHLLTHEPDLTGDLHGERLEQAIKDCVARTLPFEEGDWTPMTDVGETSGALGLMLVDGMVMRRVGMAGRFGSELLGVGDLLRPWQDEELGPMGLRTGRWSVLRAGRMAVLNADFALRAARYPEVMSCLVARAVRRSRYLAATMAIIHQPRIDVRLNMLLWELAVRWGNVHRDGIHLPLRLTHAMLADLVAARRPTVTKALGELADRSLVVWTGEHWLLTGPAPVELEELGSVALADEAELPLGAARQSGALRAVPALRLG